MHKVQHMYRAWFECGGRVRQHMMTTGRDWQKKLLQLCGLSERNMI